MEQSVNVTVSNPKSVGLAVLLAIFFGPVGLLYVTVSGALIMLAVSVVLAFFTLGLSIFLTWPISVIWAAVAAAASKKGKTSTVTPA